MFAFWSRPCVFRHIFIRVRIRIWSVCWPSERRVWFRSVRVRIRDWSVNWPSERRVWFRSIRVRIRNWSVYWPSERRVWFRSIRVRIRNWTVFWPSERRVWFRYVRVRIRNWSVYWPSEWRVWFQSNRVRLRNYLCLCLLPDVFNGILNKSSIVRWGCTVTSITQQQLGFHIFLSFVYSLMTFLMIHISTASKTYFFCISF